MVRTVQDNYQEYPSRRDPSPGNPGAPQAALDERRWKEERRVLHGQFFSPSDASLHGPSAAPLIAIIGDFGGPRNMHTLTDTRNSLTDPIDES